MLEKQTDLANCAVNALFTLEILSRQQEVANRSGKCNDPKPHVRLLKRLRDEKRRFEVELKRLVDTIAVGNSCATVMAAINEREARLRENHKSGDRTRA